MTFSAAAQLAMALDPVCLARAAGIEPDPWQARLLRSPAKQILVNCSRQSGKSTTTAALALHTALYEERALVLLLSRALRQSQELFRKCLDIYHALGAQVAEPEAESALRLELPNGSRIVSLPGTEGTVRSYSGVKLLVIDEASRVEDALYLSVLPMLAVSGGRTVLLSSPFGTRGFFFEEYKRREKWDYYEVPATECPRIAPEFLEDMHETMGWYWFEQEFMCKFLDSETAAFRSEDIERIIKPQVEQWLLS